MKFKARIRPGALVWQDFRSGKWPRDFGPCAHVATLFDGTLTEAGPPFVLRAHGFGIISDVDSYGSGSLDIGRLSDLMIDDTVRAAIVTELHRRACDKRAKLTEQFLADMAKITAGETA